jgi:hypothetical protein
MTPENQWQGDARERVASVLSECDAEIVLRVDPPHHFQLTVV